MSNNLECIKEGGEYLPQYQSATKLLQSASEKYSIPKDKRFRRLPINTRAMFYNLPPLSNGRGAGIGLGPRKDLKKPLYKCPVAPNQYLIEKYYKLEKERKLMTIKHKYPQMRMKGKIPGVGAYNLAKDNLIKDTPISIISRRDHFYTYDLKINNEAVSPLNYKPNINSIKSPLYKTIVFGSSKRFQDSLAESKRTPGPGSYNIYGSFEIGIKKKPPLN